jgi:membrane protein DedA with SNARE-associated domain
VAVFDELFRTWFEWSRDAGYAGVFLLMAAESTIIPIPSEIIMPPAAYWAAQGQMSLPLVILSGGLGSTFGSSLCYLLTATLGRAFVARWGRYFLLPPARLELAERWLASFALGGVFFARLLPVVRHLIGFPAGLIRMPFLPFAAVTFVGSTFWCGILAVFGARTLGQHPDLLNDPSGIAHVIKQDLAWFIGLIVMLGAGWLFVKWFSLRKATRA